MAESRKNTSLYGVAYKQAQVAPNSGGNVGTIYAISAETGVTAWKFEQRAGTMSARRDGWRVALRRRRERPLPRVRSALGQGALGDQPRLARHGLPDLLCGGRQAVRRGVDRVSLTQSGLSALTPELRPSTGNNLFVFALP